MSAAPTDLAMYREIVAHMEAGQGYYQAAAEAHRASGYPLFPFYSVRLPTLATFNALVGPIGSLLVAILLVLIAALVWFRYFEKFGTAGAIFCRSDHIRDLRQRPAAGRRHLHP